MKHSRGLVLGVTFVSAIFLNSATLAKTAKDCTAEWRADKAGMQSRGVTEKAYVAQCKGNGASSASTPTSAPSVSAPVTSPKRANTVASGKTAKDCTAEWRADKVGMQTRGVTEKSYVEQCKGGGTVPKASAPAQMPSNAAPSSTRTSAAPGASQKTAKDCIAECRADKAGMQARGTTEKAYVESCKGGGSASTATAPQPTQPAAPAPRRAPPAQTEAAPANRPAPPTTTAAPAPPVRAPSANDNRATLESGQFADEGLAKARCPTDTVVWVNLKSKIYHFVGTKSYGTTEHGAYMCEKEALTAEDRAAKNESHPK